MLLSYAFIGRSMTFHQYVSLEKTSQICKQGSFAIVIPRHNELRDLEADRLSMVCSDVEVEPFFQDITDEQLSRGSNRAHTRRKIGHSGAWLLGSPELSIL